MSSPATLIAILETATPQEKAHIASLLSVSGTDRTEVTTVAPLKRSAGRPKKETHVFVLPETSDGSAPTESAYRLNPFDIKEEVCVGRILTPAHADKRWSIAVYGESQCGAAMSEESDICAHCQTKEAKYAADPTYDRWCGRVTEDPLPWQHMLGTAWAKERMASGKLYWKVGATPSGGAGATGSDTESTVSSASKASKAAEKEALKAAKAAEKDAAKAAKAAEKEALKAAKAAEKEALKALKAAEKDAAKAAKAAEKDAAKAAKAAEKAALKAAKAADKTKKD
jgi:hypothetical protein